MRQDIGQLTWMSDTTKQKAYEKLNAIVNNIGYPDKWRDYSTVVIKRDDYAGNVTRGEHLRGAARATTRSTSPLTRRTGA
jgi:putative endopeptidase